MNSIFDNGKVCEPIYEGFHTSEKELRDLAHIANGLVCNLKEKQSFYDKIIISEEEKETEYNNQWIEHYMEVLERKDLISLDVDMDSFIMWLRKFVNEHKDLIDNSTERRLQGISITLENLIKRILEGQYIGKSEVLYLIERCLKLRIRYSDHDFNPKAYLLKILEDLCEFLHIPMGKMLSIILKEYDIWNEEIVKQEIDVNSILSIIRALLHLNDLYARDCRNNLSWKKENIAREPIQHVKCLGEYDPATRNIILYVRNILDSDWHNADKLIRVVFLHELVHAVLHPIDAKYNWYGAELEEPLTEYGMLYLCSKLNVVGGDNSLLPYAVSNVVGKQLCKPIFFYGYGAYLYFRLSATDDYCEKSRLLEKYYMAKYSNLKDLHVAFAMEFLGEDVYPSQIQDALYKNLCEGLNFRPKATKRWRHKLLS